MSRILCFIGCHDWRNGPGNPCTICGEHDVLFCGCADCRERCGDYDDTPCLAGGPMPKARPSRGNIIHPDLSSVALIVAFAVAIFVLGYAGRVRVECQQADALRPATVATRSHP